MTETFGVIFEARQGSRFRRVVTVPFTLVGHEVRMQVRRFVHEPGLALLDLSTLTDGIVWVDRPGGVFAIDIPATDLAPIEASPNVGWRFDVEIVPPGGEPAVYALFGGSFVVAAEVTV